MAVGDSNLCSKLLNLDFFGTSSKFVQTVGEFGKIRKRPERNHCATCYTQRFLYLATAIDKRNFLGKITLQNTSLFENLINQICLTII